MENDKLRVIKILIRMYNLKNVIKITLKTISDFLFEFKYTLFFFREVQLLNKFMIRYNMFDLLKLKFRP